MLVGFFGRKIRQTVGVALIVMLSLPGEAYSPRQTENPRTGLATGPAFNRLAQGQEQLTRKAGITLKQVITGIDLPISLSHHEPTNTLLMSTRYPFSPSFSLALVAGDGTSTDFSKVSGLDEDVEIVTQRDSRGGFTRGEIFAGTVVPGTIARISQDGTLVQNPWVTLPGETGLLNLGLHLDTTGVFEWNLIVATTAGRVWRVDASGRPVPLANVGTSLKGVTTIPDDPARYGPWAGKILAGAEHSGGFYAIDSQGNISVSALGISPQDIEIIPSDENFFGVDRSARTVWGASSSEFAGMAGDILVAQKLPGLLWRVRWTGTSFETTKLAEVSEWDQITFSSAGMGEISAVAPADKTAVVRHAPTINSGRVEGSLWQLLGEDVSLTGSSIITNDLLVPGTPTVRTKGKPSFKGVIPGSGNTLPSGYTITLGGNASLRNLITQTNPINLVPVAQPPASTGTRDVKISKLGQSVGDFATLRDLTLRGTAGAVSVPPGTYRRFKASSHAAFVLGIANSAQAAVYNFQTLNLSGQSEIRLLGPVVITLSQSLTASGSSNIGSAANLRWLVLMSAEGGVYLGGGGDDDDDDVSNNIKHGNDEDDDDDDDNDHGRTFYGIVLAPSGMVSIRGNSILRGTVSCDRLEVDGRGVLQVTEGNQPPSVNAGVDQKINLPANSVTLNGIVTDDGLPAGAFTTSWSKVTGPGTVTFGDTAAAVTTASFGMAGTYVLRLTANDSHLSASDDVTITVNPANQAPVVNAGSPQTITLPGIASLSGTATDDGFPEGNTLTLSWSKVSGPGTVTFASPIAAVTTATFGSAGSYVLRLTASDSQLTNSAEVTITVNPAPTPVIILVSPNSGQQGQQNLSVAIIGRFTNFAQGTSQAGFGEGITVNSVTVTSATSLTADISIAMSAVGGTRTLTVTTGAEVASLANGFLVNLTAPTNRPPTVSAGSNQTVTLPASAALAGTVSDDGLPVGGALSVAWSKVSGPGTVTFANANAVVTTATFGSAGTSATWPATSTRTASSPPTATTPSIASQT